MGNRNDVNEFLHETKKLVSEGKYDFVPRRKNMQSLARYGLTITDVKSEILGLVVGDYYKGSKKDFDAGRPGEIWEFKKTINGVQFYIKIKITYENNEKVLKCLGFHKDEY